MRRAVLFLLAAAAALTGVLLLRAELMTVHEPPVPGSFTNVVVVAETREEPEVLPEMTRGLASTCRLLVNADVVEQSFLPFGDGVFAFSLTPGLDEFDVRELRGCLQDLRVQHLRVDVRSIETVVPDVQGEQV